MRPDVAQAFDRMAAAARREAGISLIVTSAFRSDAEQARLFAQNPDPKWVARPGTSLHRYGTELDLGPSSAYGWLARNAKRFGFIQRYSWVVVNSAEGARSSRRGGVIRSSPVRIEAPVCGKSKRPPSSTGTITTPSGRVSR